MTIVGYMKTEMKRIQQTDTKNKTKIKHDWVRKMKFCELCKGQKSDHTIKRYMHKKEPMQESENYEIL